MSYLLEKEAICPHCQFPTPVEVWSTINVKQDPELKELLLGGELNLADCQSCRKVFYAENFFIYHDPTSQLMGFVYPKDHADQRNHWSQKTQSDFAASQAALSTDEKLNYDPLIFFGIDELVQLIQWEEDVVIQSEIAVFVAKQHDVKMVHLEKNQSRKLRIPFILPVTNGKSPIDSHSILEGLKRLNAVKEGLYLYKDAEKFLETHDKLQFEFK